MDVYKLINPKLKDEDKKKLLFDEIKNLEIEMSNKSKKNSKWSIVLGVLNAIFNLIVIISAAVIMIVTGINDLENITTIVLGGIIFAITGTNQLFKLGDKGIFYKKGTIRLKKLKGELRNIMYKFNSYTFDQILDYLTFFHSEIDDIELDLYKFSMMGEVNYDSGLQIEHDSQPNTPRNDNNSHIHIHLETPPDSPSSSPNMSRINLSDLRTNSLPTVLNHTVLNHKVINHKLKEIIVQNDNKN